MPKPKEKIYPSHVLEDELRMRGVQVQCMWEYKGPPETFVEWIVCYLVGNTPMIVQTFKDRRGWEAFTPCSDGKVKGTVDDVIARCCLPIPD